MNDNNIKTCFTLICDYCENDDYSDLCIKVTIIVNLGGVKRLPLLNFSSELVNNLATRFFFGVGNIGGKVILTSIVNGYIEYRKYGGIFNGLISIKPISRRMIMIFDLSDCKTDNAPDIDLDLVETLDHVTSFEHLTRQTFVVLCTADAPKANNNDITNHHFQPSLSTRIDFMTIMTCGWYFCQLY